MEKTSHPPPPLISFLSHRIPRRGRLRPPFLRQHTLIGRALDDAGRVPVRLAVADEGDGEGAGDWGEGGGPVCVCEWGLPPPWPPREG